MILDSVFLTILVVHFLADFALQTDWQAQNKATNVKALIMHCLTYSAVWSVMSYIFFGSIIKAWLFGTITFMAHLFTDFFTAKQAKKFFDKKDYHNGFKVVGVDQVLHYIQLWYTFKILMLLPAL